MATALLHEHPEGLPVHRAANGALYAVRPIRHGRIENGWKHRFVDIDVLSLPEDDLTLPLDVGQLQVTRVMNVTPQPIGWHGSVVWDGADLAPTLLLDGAPNDRTFRIRLEVTGS